MTTFRPRLPNRALGRPVEILREIELFGVKGFAIHHALAGHGFSVSHMETGVKIGSGTTEAGAMKATNREIIRQRNLLKVDTEEAAVQRGISKAKYDIGRYEQSRGSEGGRAGVQV